MQMKEVKRKQTKKKERKKEKQDVSFLVLKKKILDGYLKKNHEKQKKIVEKETPSVIKENKRSRRRR